MVGYGTPAQRRRRTGPRGLSAHHPGRGSETIFGIVLFGIVGLGLIALGWWGVRYGAGAVSTPSNWDEVTVERRRRTLRRGSVVCLVVGLAFMLLAGVSLTSAPPPPPPAAPVAPPAPPR